LITNAILFGRAHSITVKVAFTEVEKGVRDELVDMGLTPAGHGVVRIIADWPSRPHPGRWHMVSCVCTAMPAVRIGSSSTHIPLG
jgi:hypothetical protein